MAFKKDNIELKTKLINLKVPLKAIFIVIIVLYLFSFPIYMDHYPAFQTSVMGNESLPSPLKIFIVISPTVLYVAILTVLLIYLIFSLFADISERLSKIK